MDEGKKLTDNTVRADAPPSAGTAPSMISTRTVDIGRPAVVTPEERIEAAIPMVKTIVTMARDDISNPVEAGRQLERIADQAAAVERLLTHGHEPVEGVIELIGTGRGESEHDDDPA